MFDEMISMLEKAEIVPKDKLRKRFDRAMVKKFGVLKTPYSFWPSDKKINPSAKELLWAAILLEDKGDFRLTEGIIATEFSEKEKASGQYIVNSDIAQSSKEITSDCINELLELAPTKDFRKLLENKIKNLLNS
jgi:hypothetical protein